MTSEQFEPEPQRPFVLNDWQRRGFSEEEARGWWKARFEPREASDWQRSGVTPIDAVRWRIADVHVDAVKRWVDAGVDAREAVGWAELGFDVDRAGAHKRAGRSPAEAYGSEHGQRGGCSPSPSKHSPQAHFTRAVMGAGGWDSSVIHSYVSREWFDDEAIAWAVNGVEAGSALEWKELGLLPTEARHLQDQNATPLHTAMTWWKARIPADEVADWIGAGLSAEEAAEQRANGVTGEDAAVLRSLRNT